VFRQIGAPEIILILAVVVLLFGAKKLPELARGSGRALRIFKAETKGLIDGDDEDSDTVAPAPAPKAITPVEAAKTEGVTEPERRTDPSD
jgi:sec-independent protein translocase protein TatA